MRRQTIQALGATAAAVVLWAALTGAPAPVQAHNDREVAALRAQIDRLENRVARLERDLITLKQPGNVPLKGGTIRNN